MCIGKLQNSFDSLYCDICFIVESGTEPSVSLGYAYASLTKHFLCVRPCAMLFVYIISFVGSPLLLGILELPFWYLTYAHTTYRMSGLQLYFKWTLFVCLFVF